MTESVFQKKFANELRKRGWTVWLIEGRGVRGIPDCFVFRSAEEWWFVELKLESRKLSPHQVRRLEELNDAGIPYIVWYESDDMEFWD